MANNVTTPAIAKSGYNNFNAFYAMTRTQVNDLLSYLNTASFLDNVQLLFNTPVENIVSLKVYPFDVKAHHPTAATADNNVVVNVVTTDVDGFFMNPIPSPALNLGAYTVPLYFRNFLDYAPYTKIEMYLPYIGFVQLDTNMVMNKTVSVEYVVDYFSGKCTAFIKVGWAFDGSDGDIIMTRDGTIGVDVAIGGGQGAEIARNMLSLGIGATAGAISLGAGAIAAGAGKAAGTSSSIAGTVGAGSVYLASTTANAITAGQVHINKGGQSQPAIDFYAPQKCYLIITRPQRADHDEYAKFHGLPANGYVYCRNLEGYTIADEVFPEGLSTATADEITEIERLLKSGVILPPIEE